MCAKNRKSFTTCSFHCSLGFMQTIGLISIALNTEGGQIDLRLFSKCVSVNVVLIEVLFVFRKINQLAI